jgi:iron complex transport system ATP-binding protein
LNVRQTSSVFLSARDLSLRVSSRILVNDLSADIRGGELWCLLGPNGCGKTTLLLAFAGLRLPDAGEIYLAGSALQRWSATEAARLRGFLPQVVHDAFSATVLDCVMIGRHPHIGRWRWEAKDDRQIASDALAAVGIGHLAERDVLSLSGGERQRTALATVLAQDTAVLLLDEPVAHLDIHQQVEVMRHLQRLTRTAGKAIVVSVHDMNLAARFADRALLFLGEGRVAHGAAEDVLLESTLSQAFGHRIERATVRDRLLFLPE